MAEVTLIVRATAKPGKGAELRETMMAMLASTHKEPCEMVYDLYASNTEGRFFYFEVWPNQEALDFHASTEHYKAFGRKLPELLAEPLELNFVTKQN